ncbi:MAG: glycosyltransferase family 2 protein [Patescibacteria group bacterium]
MTKVSLLILSWNTKNLLRDCLASLRLSKFQPEIIVVDNASTDSSLEMVQKEFPEVKLIKNKINLGFAKGNNQAFRQAQGEVIMLLNSDTLVQKGAIEKLATSLMNQSEEIAAVSPLLLNEDGSVQRDPCYLKFPSPLFAIFYYNKFFKNLALRLFPFVLFSALKFEKPLQVDQLPAAAMMIRKKVWEKVGGFDENFPIYFNDVDLCFRLKKLGYKLMLIPDAKIIHFGRKSIEPVIRKEGIEKFYFLNFSSLFLFCEKNYSVWKTWLIKIIVFFHLFSTLKFNLIKQLIKR